MFNNWTPLLLTSIFQIFGKPQQIRGCPVHVREWKNGLRGLFNHVRLGQVGIAIKSSKIQALGAQFIRYPVLDENSKEQFSKERPCPLIYTPQISKFCQIRQIKLTRYLLKSTHFPNTFVEKNETCLTKFGQVMSKSGEYCVNGHNLGKTL